MKKRDVIAQSAYDAALAASMRRRSRNCSICATKRSNRATSIQHRCWALI